MKEDFSNEKLEIALKIAELIDKDQSIIKCPDNNEKSDCCQLCQYSEDCQGFESLLLQYRRFEA